MLSIVPIKTSSVQSGYYLKQDGDYYIEDIKEKELYQWMGKGAERLGLVGTIDPKVHADVYNGVLPGNIVLGKRSANGALAGRPGYDLTFSMNKELSLIVCCSRDKALSDYFLNAHVNAVKTAMLEVEKMASARRSVNGEREYEATGNIIASLCTHFSSRAGDPQVHTHALVANATERSDGKWRALSTDMQRKHGFYEKIRDNGTFLGAIYQNEMALAAKEKGFDVTSVNKHGMFAIRSFPEDVRQHFSKRRQQIVSIVDSLQYANKDDKILYNMVAQHSKASKEKINIHGFMEKSKSAMSAFLNFNHDGKDFDRILSDCIEQKDKGDEKVSSSADEAVLDSVNVLSRFSVKLDANRIIEKAMEFDLGSSSIRDLQLALDQQIKSGALYRTASGHFTSKSLLELEKRLMEKLSPKHEVNEPLSQHKQQKTVKKALQSHRFCLIEMPSKPDDKLRLIDDLIKDLEAGGKKVVLLTQTKSMASDHNEHHHSKNHSLWQQLKQIGKADRAQSLYGFLHRYEASTSSRINNLFSGKGKEVFLIDEGERLSINVAEKLIDLSKRREASLIFLSNETGVKRHLSSDVISLLKTSLVPVLNMQDRDQEKMNSTVIVHEIKADLNMSGSRKQEHRQMVLATKVVDQYKENIHQVEVLSTTKSASMKQATLIREELKRNGFIGEEERKIITEHAVYLSQEEKKHAKYFKNGWIAKTYVGRGQFSEREIVGVDENNNRLRVKGRFGRERLESPKKFLENPNTQLIEKNELFISDNERVRLNNDNWLSKQLGLSTTTSYRVIMKGNKVILEPENEKLKAITTRLSSLNAMDWSYNYTKTIHEVINIKKSAKKVILDAPSYALDKKMVASLSHQYSAVEIYTDNQKRAERKLKLEPKKLLAVDLNRSPHQETNSVMQKAVDYGISVIGSREAAFTFKSVVEKSVSYAIGSMHFNEVRDELRNRVRSGDLMARKSSTGDVLIATKETIQLERDIIQQIKDGKGAVDPFLSKENIQNKLSNTTLTEGQKAACNLLATTSDRFVMVQGYAGTGKSTMLETLQNALIQSKAIHEGSIIALAPTHKAVKELVEKGIEAQTLKSFLVDEMFLSENGYKALENKLILLDESSMVGNRDFQALQSIVSKAKNCRCAYIGDTAQLLSVENGKPSEIAYISREANISIAIMSEVLRQKDPALKSIVQDLMKGTKESVSFALDQLKKMGFIVDSSSCSGKYSTEDSLENLVKYYCALSSDERANTVIAAATNKDRFKINTGIRSIRQTAGELQGKAVTTTILTDSRLTDAELHHAQNYRSGDIAQLNGQYFSIAKVDVDKNTLILEDLDSRIKVLNLDLIPKHTTLALFHPDKIDIQANDTLKWTKSDKDRGLIAHENLNVTHVDKDKKFITAISEKGKSIEIDLNQHQNQHIDYNYASTVHGLQGATEKSTLIYLNSQNTLSNTMRLLYVAVTRSTDQVRIFTDNFDKVHAQIVNEKGNKQSALEAMGLLKTKESRTAEPAIKTTVTRPTSEKQPVKHAHDKKDRIDAKSVEDALRIEVQRVCEGLFGERNAQLSNKTEWRYGRKGSLSIAVSGQHQGSFNNFETGERGGMIQLIMSELGLDFKTALEHGSRMLGDNLSIQRRLNQDHSPIDKKSIESTDRMAYIHSLVKQSIPVIGTLAEKYLTERKIKNISSDDLMFIKRVSTGTGNKEIQAFSSAMVAIARDMNGDMRTIQLTYLDSKTGARMKDLTIEKRTLSSPKGSAVNLTPDIKIPEITFVAEGIETALSIRDAIPPTQKDHIQVLASLGISNFSNVADVKSSDNIVLVLDNDKDSQKQAVSINSAISKIEQAGKKVVCMQPTRLNDQKTDYNDLAQAGRLDVIRKDIDLAIKKVESSSKADRVKESDQHNQLSKQDMSESFKLDRERLD